MGMAGIGIPSLILIIIIALIIFGPKRLPEIGKAAGQTLQEFKNTTNDLMNDEIHEDIEQTETKKNSNHKQQ